MIGVGIFLVSAFYGLGIGALHDWRMGKAYDINFLLGLSGMAVGAFIMQGIPLLMAMVGLCSFGLFGGLLMWYQGLMKGADIWGIILYSASGAVVSLPLLMASYALTIPIYRYLYTRKFQELRSDEGVRALPGFLIAWIIGVAASLII